MSNAAETLRSSVPQSSFIDQITVAQEPRALISRFLLAADQELARRNIQLRVATFADLHDVYTHHRPTFTTLVPFFDHTAAAIDSNTAECFIAYSGSNEPISTTAVRVWDLQGTTLRQELESLRLFYNTNVGAWAGKVKCVVTAPIADTLSGQALYCGAYWVRPDLRGHGLGALVPAISRYYALGRWAIDYKFTFGSMGFLDPFVREMYQYEDYQGDFFLSKEGQPTFKWLLLWARTSFMLDRLPGLIDALNDQSSTSLGRNAQHPKS
jgi:hypothetical protein